MGGGNAQKSATARNKKLAAAASAGKAHDSEDRKKQAQANNAIQCKVCLVGFPKTVRKAELEAHLEAKHAKLKKTVAEAMPDFVVA
jgi:hypothetical protein